MENSSSYFENNLVTYCPENFFNLSDGTLITEDGCSFKIHKFILARSSQFFYCLFCSFGNEEEDKKGILIPFIEGVDLSNILSYLYTGNIQVTESNIVSLVASSDYLQLDDLLFKLKQHLRMNLTHANCLSVLKISLRLHLDDFFKESFRFVQMHFESLVLCEDSKIPELPHETLIVLLGDKNLRVTSEDIVWLSIVKWVEADTPNRLPLVPDLLKHLAISDIDENVANEILQHDIVAKNPSCREICNLKSLISDAGNLPILHRYFQTQIRPPTALCEQRQPSKLYLIYKTDFRSDDIPIYVSYDEDVDFWRKLTEAHGRHSTLLSANGCIYMFQRDRIQSIQCYSIIEKQWNDIVFYRTQRISCDAIVALAGFIYVLGGLSDMDGALQMTGDVDVYDCENGEWLSTTPMLPVGPSFKAVACNNVIYTLGPSRQERVMIAQAFDPASETWNILPSPPSIRWSFTMLVYRGMIYVIGGYNTHDQYIQDVEVFDPDRNEWYTEVNLPNAYKMAKAVVLNDKLIAYENTDGRYAIIHPPVQWNVHQRCWESLENSSMKNLRMHAFLTIENNDCINAISRESKDPATIFEHSPFS